MTPPLVIPPGVAEAVRRVDVADIEYAVRCHLVGLASLQEVPRGGFVQLERSRNDPPTPEGDLVFGGAIVDGSGARVPSDRFFRIRFRVEEVDRSGDDG